MMSQNVLNKFVRPRVPGMNPDIAGYTQVILPTPVSQRTTSQTKGGIMPSVNFG